MKIGTIWWVSDPGQESTLGDILGYGDPTALCRWAFGTPGHMVGDFESLTVYTDEAEARADAEERVAARDAESSASTSTGSCRVWELFGGQVRLYENGAVESWDANAECWRNGWGTWGTSPIVRIDEVRHGEWRAAVGAYRAKPPGR